MHTLRREYVKDTSGSVGQDCGWVDYVQWQPETLSYVYACPIRLSLRAGSEPAEWDPGRRPSSSNNQSSIILHHFPRLYGPSVDEPICMIEAAGDYAGTYYYHFDALGSVVALTDADADDVQKYDYSVWGQVGAWDPDHPNPYLFTGRRFDTETGLYYYRARYYHPEIGRFLQTDPIGYGDGMNWYAYCGNSPLAWGDPFGLWSLAFSDPADLGLDYKGGPDPNPNDGIVESPPDGISDIAVGAEFAEAANDFDTAKAMKSPDDVLETLAGMDLTGLADIYFFDHHGSEIGQLEFGDEKKALSGGALKDFCAKLGALLPPGCTIHFRQCNVGTDPGEDGQQGTLITDLASWTGRSVTGAMGAITYSNRLDGKTSVGVELDVWDKPNGKYYGDVPDYYSNTGYRMAYRDPADNQIKSQTVSSMKDPWYRPRQPYRSEPYESKTPCRQ